MWQESPIYPDILNSFLNGGIVAISSYVGMFVFNLMADFCSTCLVFMPLSCRIFASSVTDFFSSFSFSTCLSFFSASAFKYFVITCGNVRCPSSLFHALLSQTVAVLTSICIFLTISGILIAFSVTLRTPIVALCSISHRN